MKLAFPVATPETTDAAMLALRGPLAGSFETLRRLGYGGVELMVREPSVLNVAEVRRIAADSGMVVGAVSTGQLRKEDGLCLNDPDESRRRRAVDRTKAVLDFAAEFDACVNIGSLRGHAAAGDARRASIDAAARSFRELLAHNNVPIAIEPQCKWVINWLNTVAETLEFISTFPSPQLRILFDVYHARLEERSVSASLVRARPWISWVQVADSNRLAPGYGSGDFADALRVLQALDYDGFVCVECLPIPDAQTAAAEAALPLKRVLEEPDV